MNWPFKDCEVWALASGLERLKEHDLERSWLVKDIPGEKATNCHALSQNKATRQRREMQDTFVILSSDRKQRVLGTVKCFNTKQAYGFINRSDTYEHIYVHQTAITQNYPQKIKRSISEGEIMVFNVEVRNKGREAINMTRPDGKPFQGSSYDVDRRCSRGPWVPGSQGEVSSAPHSTADADLDEVTRATWGDSVTSSAFVRVFFKKATPKNLPAACPRHVERSKAFHSIQSTISRCHRLLLLQELEVSTEVLMQPVLWMAS